MSVFEESMYVLFQAGCAAGSVVNAEAFHQCSSGSILFFYVIRLDRLVYYRYSGFSPTVGL